MKIITIENRMTFLRILNIFEEQTKYIELLQIEEELDQNCFLNQIDSSIIISNKAVTNWQNTGAKGNLIKLNVTLNNKEELFKLLKSYPSFFFNSWHLKNGECVINTEFGLSNIAFFDQQGALLFYTITHEEIAWIKSNAL